jgi:NitT/TauT family transport system substrate-binding protein
MFGKGPHDSDRLVADLYERVRRFSMTVTTGVPDRKQFALMLGVLVMFCVCGCHSREAPQGLTTVRIAVPDSGFSYLPVFIAQELGFYRDAGLDTTLEAVYGGGSKSMGAILGGSVDCGGISLELAIQIAAEGRRVESFVTLIDRPSYVLVVSPASKRGVHEVKDLRGAALGVSSPGSGTHNFANYVLATHKVPSQTSALLGSGLAHPPSSLSSGGQIDAGILMSNSITVIERRFPQLLILVDTRTAEGTEAVFGTDVYPAQGVAASPDWLRH